MMVCDKTPSFEAEARHAWKSLQAFRAAQQEPVDEIEMDWSRDEIEAIVSCTTRHGIKRICEQALEDEAKKMLARIGLETAVEPAAE